MESLVLTVVSTDLYWLPAQNKMGRIVYKYTLIQILAELKWSYLQLSPVALLMLLIQNFVQIHVDIFINGNFVNLLSFPINILKLSSRIDFRKKDNQSPCTIKLYYFKTLFLSYLYTDNESNLKTGSFWINTAHYD